MMRNYYWFLGALLGSALNAMECPGSPLSVPNSPGSPSGKYSRAQLESIGKGEMASKRSQEISFALIQFKYFPEHKRETRNIINLAK